MVARRDAKGFLSETEKEEPGTSKTVNTAVGAQEVG